MKFDLSNPTVKKVIGYLSIALAGAVGISEALSKQKKEQEFDEMKEAIKQLKSKM